MEASIKMNNFMKKILKIIFYLEILCLILLVVLKYDFFVKSYFFLICMFMITGFIWLIIYFVEQRH